MGSFSYILIGIFARKNIIVLYYLSFYLNYTHNIKYFIKKLYIMV
jgi:hypothetical protein